MQKFIKQTSKSDNDLVESDTETHTPLKLENNFEQGASKKKNFSFIDLQSKNYEGKNNKTFTHLKEFDTERKSGRSKTEITPSPEKMSKNQLLVEKMTTNVNKIEEDNENNLQNIKKEYEKTIVSRDLDQTLAEISNIKIINNVNTNCNISLVDVTLNLSEKMSPECINEVKFPKIDDNNKLCEIILDKIPSNESSKTKTNMKKNINLINTHIFRNLVFSPNVSESVFKVHLLNTYKGLVYAKRFLKPPSTEFLREKMVSLPEIKAPRYKSLFIDLDETLIHTCSANDNPDHLIKGNDEKSNEILIGLNMRPLCIEFLKKISQYYEIYIFTAATLSYANAVVNFLDPVGQVINGVLSRNNCLITKNGMFIKDLRIIKNRELKNLLLIDNLAHSFGLQIENGIPILEFQNDRKDRELKYLFDYLLQALYVDDLRVFNKKNMNLNYLASLRLEDLLKT